MDDRKVNPFFQVHENMMMNADGSYITHDMCDVNEAKLPQMLFVHLFQH